MLKWICTLFMTLAVGVSAQQGQSCTDKAADCKPRIHNSKYYPDNNCTCYTCGWGTAHPNIVCTNDDKELAALSAKLRDQDETEWAAVKGDKVITGRVVTENDKMVFVSDEGKGRWVVTNAEDVGEHVGQHVRVKAKVNDASDEIRVDAVKKMYPVHPKPSINHKAGAKK